MNWLFGIMLTILGLVMLFFPQWVYDLTESWKQDGAGEPSDFYKLHLRVGGGIFTAVGIAGTLFFLFA